MITLVNRDLWKVRKGALTSRAAQLGKVVDDSPGILLQQRKQLTGLLACFDQFLTLHFDYFNERIFSQAEFSSLENFLAALESGLKADGQPFDALDPHAGRSSYLGSEKINLLKNVLQTQNADGKQKEIDFLLNRLKAFPPDHVMRVTLEQAAFDLDVIERIIAQRKISSSDELETLALADYLASETLQFAVATGLLPAIPIVFTYFQKSPSIRLTPYANVALIGIPYTTVNTPQDFLAIPHEVGHYVFWHGKGVRAKPFIDFDIWAGKNVVGDNNHVHNRTLMLESAIFNWQEEIFADVYGALVAGKLLAQDFQELQLETSNDDFLEDDADHPIPALRPYIYIKVFEKIKHFVADRNADARLDQTVQTLQAMWESSLAKRLSLEVGELPAQVFSLRLMPQKYLFRILAGKDQLREAENVEKRLKQAGRDRKFIQADILVKVESIICEILARIFSKNNFQSTELWGQFFNQVAKAQKDGQAFKYANFLAAFDQSNYQGNSEIPSFNEGGYEKLVNEWNKDWSKGGPPDWLPVFKAAGWTIEGPTSPWTTG